MYKTNAKWLMLGILAIILFLIINLSSSQYVETRNKQITLNIRKPMYTVEFHANNGGSDEPTTQSFTYGTAQNLTANSFTNTGNNFKEWNTQADGNGISYSDEAEVNNLTGIDGDTVQLYAIWETSGTYRVINKKMDLDGVNYTTDEIDILNAEEGDVVTPVPKSYTGFITPDEQTVTVAGDGSTTITYLYTRKQFHVSIINEDLLTISNGITSGYYYYGQPIHIEFTPNVPGVTFHFDDYLITTIDEENVRSSSILNEDIIDITVENHLIIEPEFSSYPVGYFKPFNGTPWMVDHYAADHDEVYRNLYTFSGSQTTGPGPLQDPLNSSYDQYMFGDLNNPTNGLSKKGITEFKRNTTKTIEEIEAMYNAGTAMLVSNEADDGYKSPIEVYAWIEGTTMYWDSRAYIVKFHPDTIAPFYDMTSATSIDLTNLDTSLITSFYSFFNTCLNVTEIKGYINTSGVVNPGASDTYDYSGDVDAKNNKSSKQGMAFMFNDCKVLTNIDVSKFNTSNVVDMKRMFAGCAALKSLDLFSFDTSNVKSMFWMFRNCRQLTEIRLSSFDTTNVVNMYAMFVGNTNLKTIYLGNNFQTPNLVNCASMFRECSKLETIYSSHDFDRTNVITHSGMFTGCTRLVGGRDTEYETAYNSSIIDKTYAQIADATHPGYFTSNVHGTRYYITYNLSGGTADNRTYYFKTTPSFSLSRPTKEGYVFTGWTGSNGDVPELDIIISQGTTGDKIYTANYEPITYTVSFNANGGTGSMDSQSFTYDVADTLSTNLFTRDGATFNGWNTMPNGTGTSYTDGESVSNLANSNGTIVNLYAVWKYPINITYCYGTVTFSGTSSGTNYLNSGIKLFNTLNKNKNVEISFNASNMTYVSNGDKKDAIVCSQLEGVSPYPGFALYHFNTNDVKLQANTTARGQNGLNLTSLSITPPDLGLITIKRINNKLYLDSTVVKDNNNNDINFADINKNMDNVLLTFGANLSEKSELRRFARGTLSNISVKITYEEIDLPNIVFPEPTLNGYTFDSWYTEPNGAGTEVTSTDQITESITLYANWISQ